MTDDSSLHRTVWEGSPQTLTSMATQGKVQSTRYRLTATALHVERGLVRTDSQQVPLIAVYDIDVKQSMTQKARGVGDVVVHINTGAHAETITLEQVQDPKKLRDLINQTVADAKRYQVEQGRTHVMVASSAPAAPAVAPAAGGDLVEQLTKLAALRDAGVLTEAEFVAQKTRLLG
jgi:membrane protein YdbS with pleckstrin-like domain